MRELGSRKSQSRSLSFNIIAPLYDLGVWFVALFFGGEDGFREEFIAEARPLEEVRTLEIFAGTATLSLRAVREGAVAVAADVSMPMLRVAKEKTRRQGQGLVLVRCDSASLPFQDASFGRVLVCMGLHEVALLEIEAVLRETARVLTRGGLVVIEDFHKAQGLAGVMQSIFFLFTGGRAASEWLSSDIQGVLRRAGFKGFMRRFLHNGLLQLITAKKA